MIRRARRPVLLIRAAVRCTFAPAAARFAIPSAVWPWIDDGRQLGAMVRRVMMPHGADAMQVAMDDPGLSDGWWVVEGDGGVIWRWADGDASPYPLELDTETSLGNAA